MSRLVRFITQLFALTFLAFPSSAVAQNPVVHAVLFYSPTCPHCREVIEQDLPPLWEIYGGEVEFYHIPETPEDELVGPSLVAIFGEQMAILYVNTFTDIGSALFAAAVEEFNIPREEQVVPTLIVGQIRLIGSADIPQMFPDIIEKGLTQGGIDWPEIPGLKQQIASMVPMPLEGPSPEPTTEASPILATETQLAITEEPSSTATRPAPATSTPENLAIVPPVDLGSHQPTFVQRFRLDPVGNSLSILVLVGMMASIIGAGFRLSRTPTRQAPPIIHRIVPLLALAGIAIAGYLTYVETTGAEAVCGPVGDCNTVQQSAYAMLFGSIPVGALGLLGYAGILTAWIVNRTTSGKIASAATLSIFCMAAFGTLFSVYLTFLEPFVIGATCIWCLSSSIIIAVILWLSADPAAVAFRTWPSGS